MSVKTKEVIVDILCEFLEVSIHNILYTRRLYPEEIFEKRKHYGTVVYQSIHPQVNEYISESLKAIRFHAKANQLKKVLICVLNSKGHVYERYVFDIHNLQDDFTDDALYLKLEQDMRDFYIKLHTSTFYLHPLDEDDEASFRIMIHTTEYSSLKYNDEPALIDFPWVHVGDKDFIVRDPGIVPIHTVQNDPLNLQIFVENCSKK